MNKSELIAAAASLLRENGIRKIIKIPKRTFTISDESGLSKDFVVEQQDKEVLYTGEDIKIILEAFIEIIKDNIKHGVETTVHGFGTLAIHRRAARRVKRPDTGEWVDIKECHVPKFTFGKDLRMASRVYDMMLDEKTPFEEVSNIDG